MAETSEGPRSEGSVEFERPADRAQATKRTRGDRGRWTWVASAMVFLAAASTVYIAVDNYRDDRASTPEARARQAVENALELEQVGRRSEGFELMRAALGEAPSDPSVYREAGFFFIRGSLWKEGIESLCQTMRWDDDNVNVLVNLGIAYTAVGQPDDAVIHYEVARDILPESSFVLRNAAVAWHDLGEFERAEQYSRAAIEIDNHKVAWGNLVLALIAQEKWIELLEASEQGLESNPDSESFTYSRIVATAWNSAVVDAEHLAQESGWSDLDFIVSLISVGLLEDALTYTERALRDSSSEYLAALGSALAEETGAASAYSDPEATEQGAAELQRLQTERGLEVAGYDVEDYTGDPVDTCDRILARSDPFFPPGGDPSPPGKPDADLQGPDQPADGG